MESCFRAMNETLVRGRVSHPMRDILPVLVVTSKGRLGEVLINVSGRTDI